MVKSQAVERWMSHRNLPYSLRESIRHHERYKWQDNLGVDEETLIRKLPEALRADIKRHLCLPLLRKVSYGLPIGHTTLMCYIHMFVFKG